MVVAIMKGKNKDILNLEVEALRAFFKYCSATEKIEKILQDLYKYLKKIKQLLILKRIYHLMK